jgi:uncharacterized membrane protein YfcA
MASLGRPAEGRLICTATDKADIMLTSMGLELAIGVILALTGAGSGILAVPAHVLGVRQSVAQAGPVGLLAVGMAAALGTLLGLQGARCVTGLPC